MTSPSYEHSLAADALVGRWAVALGLTDSPAEVLQDARRALAEAFWYPVYGYLRASELSSSDAAARTEGALSGFVNSPVSAEVMEERPLLRRHFLHLAREAARTPDPAGGPGFSIDQALAESRFVREAAKPAEALFQRVWALSILEAAMDAVERHYVTLGAVERFRLLQPFLGYGVGGDEAYEMAARELKVSNGAARAAVFDLRQLYRATLRERIARTVVEDRQVDAELTALTCSL